MAGCPSSYQTTRIREETLESGGPLQRTSVPNLCNINKIRVDNLLGLHWIIRGQTMRG